MPVMTITDPRPRVPGFVREARRLRGLGEAIPGYCNVIDASNNQCQNPFTGEEIPCNLYRECTPESHFEYALPGATGNVNIWQETPSGFQWDGPAPAPQAQPQVPTPTTAYIYSPTQSAMVPVQINPPASPPSAPATTPQVTTTPAPPPQPQAPAQPQYVIVTPPATTQQPTQTQPPATQTTTTTTRTSSPTSSYTAVPISGSAATAAQQPAAVAESWYQRVPWWLWLAAAGAAYMAARKD